MKQVTLSKIDELTETMINIIKKIIGDDFGKHNKRVGQALVYGIEKLIGFESALTYANLYETSIKNKTDFKTDLRQYILNQATNRGLLK